MRGFWSAAHFAFCGSLAVDSLEKASPALTALLTDREAPDCLWETEGGCRFPGAGVSWQLRAEARPPSASCPSPENSRLLTLLPCLGFPGPDLLTPGLLVTEVFPGWLFVWRQARPVSVPFNTQAASSFPGPLHGPEGAECLFSSKLGLPGPPPCLVGLEVGSFERALLPTA